MQDPMVVRGDDKICAKQHLPYVPGGLSKNSTVYCTVRVQYSTSVLLLG